MEVYSAILCNGMHFSKARIGSTHKDTTEIKELVETQMSKDDETTAYQLHKLLTDSGYSLSIFHCVKMSA